MAELAHDPNKQDSPQTSTNILTPQSSPVQTQGNEETVPSVSNSGANYVSNGNPYGNYGSPQSQQQTQNTKPQSVKKSSSSTTPSSGMHTNVQSYIDKNKVGSQQLGQAVSGKLQSSADLARQSLAGTEKSFQQGMDAGSLENWQGAVDEAKGAYQQAAGQKAAERQFVDNSASMYRPEQIKQSEGGAFGSNSSGSSYSAEDQALIDSNMARVVFGDGSTRDFETQAEAQTAINDWNRQNPGYYTYGDQEQLSVSDDRLRDILNTKYSGPSDLYQAAGYSDVYNQFDKAQNLQDLAQSTGFKGTLLKETFENPNMTYSLGNQLLDDLLLGSGTAANTLRETAQNLGSTPSGRIGDDLTQGVIDARNLAAQRSSDIDDVRTGARSALDEVALGRESEVNQRLNQVEEDWEKYPQYFRDKFEQERLANEEARKNSPEAKALEAFKAKYVNPDGSIKGKGLSGYIKRLTREKELEELQRAYDSLGKNVGLSQTEAEMLGVQGGEGLYNIIEDQGVDGLLKTAKSDRNKLISRDEQSQLSRLQSIAGLANDYGSADSGINYYNEFTNRDLAGQQNALSALDMDNFINTLQGSEKNFRDYAEGANITGVGHGSASSRGLAGSKSSSATEYLTENLGKLLGNSDAYRNMYSDEGVNQDNVNKILGLAQGMNTGTYGLSGVSGLNQLDANLNIEGIDFSLNPLTGGYQNTLAGVDAAGNLVESAGQGYDNLMHDILGNNVVADVMGSAGKFYSEIGKGVQGIASGVGKSLFGSSSGLSAAASAEAQANALKDLKKKINQTLNNQGYSNQLNVKQDRERDLELLQLLGLLDTTNR